MARGAILSRAVGIAGQKRLARRKKIGVGRLGAQSDSEDAGGDERQTAQSPFQEQAT